MKRLAVILLTLCLASCYTYHYPFEGRLDERYYARSAPAYTYVDGFYGFPYYGPYSWAWYHPVWYSPIMGHHYSWCRPYDYWCGPGSWPGGVYARHDRPGKNKPVADDPPAPVYDPRPVLPVDMREMVIENREPRAGFKSQAYRTPSAKYRAVAKSPKPAYTSPQSAPRPSYGASRPVSASRPARPSPVRRDSEHEY